MPRNKKAYVDFKYKDVKGRCTTHKVKDVSLDEGIDQIVECANKNGWARKLMEALILFGTEMEKSLEPQNKTKRK